MELLEKLEEGKPTVIELEKGEKAAAARVALQNAAKVKGFNLTYRSMGADLVLLKEPAAK